MFINKKIIISFFIFILIFTSFSGCILDNIFRAADFSLNSYSIIDDQGFPALSVYFNCSGRVNLKTFNDNSNIIDNDFFYHDGNTTLNIGEYKESVRPRKYTFKVYDKNDKEIFCKELSFIGFNLSIISCEQLWWEDNDNYILIGLKIFVRNLGDTPVYPFYADMIVNSEIYTGYILPSVVLPSYSSIIYLNLIHEGIFIYDSFEVVIKDKNNFNLVTGIFNFDYNNTVSTKFFYKGLDKSIKVPYPDYLYEYYSNLDRIVVENYSVYILDHYDDFYIEFFLNKIIESNTHGKFDLKSDVKKIEYVNGFVQALDYKPDSSINDTFEYPRYPIETIFNGNGGGDCEDKSILTACFLNKLGYEVALLRLPKHMAVGVKLDNDTITKYNFYIDNYYFLETTNQGKPLGYIPNEYESPSELYIYPITITDFVIHNWKNGVITIYSKTECGDFVKVIAYIENLGNKIAENIEFKGLFYNNQNFELTSKSIIVGNISTFDKKKVILSIPKPSDLDTWFETRIMVNGKVIDIHKSNSNFD
jgi:hypothetical protein